MSNDILKEAYFSSYSGKWLLFHVAKKQYFLSPNYLKASYCFVIVRIN